jgi:hypothetical protein
MRGRRGGGPRAGPERRRKMTTRLRIAIAVVLGIVLGATGIVDASHDAARASRIEGLAATIDRTYGEAVKQMQREARADAVRIVPEKIVMGSNGGVHIVSAPMQGSEELVFPHDFVKGAVVSFLFLHGVKGVPTGFYSLSIVAEDPNAAHAELIQDEEVIMILPVVITDDPTPELGPRQDVTVGGGSVASAIYIKGADGGQRCVHTDVIDL